MSPSIPTFAKSAKVGHPSEGLVLLLQYFPKMSGCFLNKWVNY